MKKAFGLIVNPVAGMGGSVGLKGSDGEVYKKVRQLGAEPVTPKRTKHFLAHIRRRDDITLLVAPGKMGEKYVRAFDIPYGSGVCVYPSSTNFLLAKTEIPDTVRRFRDIGVFIADLSNQLPPGFVRVSIGTREENDALITGYMKIRQFCE